MPDFTLEQNILTNTHYTVMGIDEVGRGALAGIVVVAAVILPTFVGDIHIAKYLHGINDSKKLTQRKREYFFEKMKDTPSINFAIGESTAQDIDSKGINTATTCATEAAVSILYHLIKMNKHIDTIAILADAGLEKPNLSYIHRYVSIIKGDTISLSIAAASIIAKCYRDSIMEELHLQHEYGLWQFDKNKGYGTKQHLERIANYGYSPIHRKSFNIKPKIT